MTSEREDGGLGLRSGDRVAARYVLDTRLGGGGLATAWRARDLVHDEEVTLKLLGDASPARRDALLAEFVRLGGLEHPHLVRVRDFGVDAHGARPGQLVYYAAHHVVGRDIATHARECSWTELAPALVDALSALAFLHSLGIRHGDFKPDNVLVGPDGRATLIDLSAASALRSEPSGEVSGTPGFLAPELLAGQAADARADLYAVGVTLSALIDVLPRTTEVPSSVRELCRRLCAHDPAGRPSSVAEVLEALGAEAELGAHSGAAARLIGRGAELRSLGELLDAFLRGEPGPRTVAVLGAPGVGKTRLLSELAWLAQPRCRVAESSTRARNPIGVALGLAMGGDALPASLDALLEAREHLTRGAPTILVLDDVHRLEAHDAELLAALLRLAAPTDALLVLVSGPEPLDAELTIRLAPLEPAELAAWDGGQLSASALAHLERITGGYPSLVRSVLARVRGGRLSEGDLASLEPLSQEGAPPAELLARLDAGARRALAWLATERARGSLRSAPPAELGASLRALVHTGLVRLDDGAFHLTMPLRAASLRDALGPEVTHEAHRAHAEASARRATLEADPRRGSQRAALAVEHLLAAGDEASLDRAAGLLAERSAEAELEPRAWVRGAEALVALEGGPTPRAPRRALLAAASIFEAAGAPGRALSVLASLRRATPPSELGALHARAAGASLKAGRPREAARYARHALRESTDAEVKGRALIALAHGAIQLGDHQAALQHVARAADPKGELDPGMQASLRAQLLEARGLASVYAGAIDAARVALAAARALADASPRTAVRLASYDALAAWASGDLSAAEAGYREALRVAREGGLDDQLASTRLNLGTVLQRRGEWGAAQRTYERALHLSTALAKRSTRTTVEINLANLFASVGLLDRARVMLERARPHASSKQSCTLALIEADLAFAGDDLRAARAGYAHAASVAQKASAPRERLEAHVQLVEVALRDGSIDEATVALERAAALAGTAPGDDLALRLDLARGALALSRRAWDEAVSTLERAEAKATAASEHELAAQARARLSRAYAGAGAPTLAARAEREARRAWERTALSLPHEAREVFFRHPMRRALGRDAPSAAALDAPRQVRRLLEINRRLTSTLDTAAILETALDAAIELTGAERGFVLLRPIEGDAEPAVELARNVDRENLGGANLEFSRRIAEQVIASGEPVLTHDAGEDERFRGNASVHSMRLKSVLAAPIRTAERTLGALYLDNRLRIGRFAVADAELLLGFSDQVAVALENARLVEELRHKTELLERQAEAMVEQRERIEELVAQQSDTIGQLGAEVRSRRRARGGPMSFGEVRGQSAAMRELFALLDRVASSPLDVLVRGESGTGKELVARGIHGEGPRRDRPFVAINCAAIPENLLESELFGHRRGAFTGADRDREGLFVAAGGGTLFLDEVGEMPLAMQAKLLRALQEREVLPVGATGPVPFDARVVSATHRDLPAQIAAGRFREDLYYRLAVVEVRIPPLRERREDISLLAESILAALAQRHGAPQRTLATDAITALEAHSWPGNVRELENVLARAWVMGTGRVVRRAHLGLEPGPSAIEAALPVGRARQEAARIRGALERMDWNVSEVARALEIPRNTLYRKLRRYGLERPPRDLSAPPD